MFCSNPLLTIQSWTCLAATRSFSFKHRLKTSQYMNESTGMPCCSRFFRTSIASLVVFAFRMCRLTLPPRRVSLVGKLFLLPVSSSINLTQQRILYENNNHESGKLFMYLDIHTLAVIASPYAQCSSKSIVQLKRLHKANKDKASAAQTNSNQKFQATPNNTSYEEWVRRPPSS